MLSLQGQSSSKAPTDLTQEFLVWKAWKHDHPEFKRQAKTEIDFDGKILILGGYVLGQLEKPLNLILMDPETQKFQLIPSTGDAEFCCWSGMSACHWKDSKIVVFGGFGGYEQPDSSTGAIITLKDLDSENPYAHWEKIEMATPTELNYCHSAHIYEDKMFVVGGIGPDEERKNEVWCLDLADFTWSQCDFPRYATKENKEDVELRAFHENKAYIVLEGSIGREKVEVGEFNFETLSSRTFIIPEIQPEPNLIFEACPQVIDGKIYFFGNFNRRTKENSPQRQIWAYDLDSQNWTEIKTESCASLSKVGHMFRCGNHLIFEPYLEQSETLYGEFWSLPLNPPRMTKTSSTSTNVNKVQQTMKEFFFEAPYSDISFKVESQVIPAHKWLLTQRNKFFSDLLTNEIPEEQTSKLHINNLKASTFRVSELALLEYLYSEHVEIDDTIALELLQQADKYSIPSELKTACERHLVQSIKAENYIAIGKLAESVGATFLRDAVVGFIARNMKKIKPRKDFNTISDTLLRDSIVKFIVK